jgi:threonine synthase
VRESFGNLQNFDKALNLVKELSGNILLLLLNSVNPFRIEGQKTAVHEICESLK